MCWSLVCNYKTHICSSVEGGSFILENSMKVQVFTKDFGISRILDILTRNSVVLYGKNGTHPTGYITSINLCISRVPAIGSKSEDFVENAYDLESDRSGGSIVITT